MDRFVCTIDCDSGLTIVEPPCALKDLSNRSIHAQIISLQPWVVIYKL